MLMSFLNFKAKGQIKKTNKGNIIELIWTGSDLWMMSEINSSFHCLIQERFEAVACGQCGCDFIPPVSYWYDRKLMQIPKFFWNSLGFEFLWVLVCISVGISQNQPSHVSFISETQQSSDLAFHSRTPRKLFVPLHSSVRRLILFLLA